MKTTIIFLLFGLFASAQSWEFSIQQDPKIAFQGISKAKTNPALNVISRITFKGYEFKNSRIKPTLNFSFEFADLNETFQRYSIGPGFEYRLSELASFGLIYDLGIISRGTNRTRQTKPLYLFESNSFQIFGKIKINKRFSLIITGQYTQRTDYLFYLPANIVSNKWIYSNFVGLSYGF